jgi:hypothetical protein
MFFAPPSSSVFPKGAIVCPILLQIGGLTPGKLQEILGSRPRAATSPGNC